MKLCSRGRVKSASVGSELTNPTYLNLIMKFIINEVVLETFLILHKGFTVNNVRALIKKVK